MKIWINGRGGLEKSARRAVRLDDDWVAVTLEGPNLVLVKVEQWDGDIGWAVRFEDPRDQLTYGLPE